MFETVLAFDILIFFLSMLTAIFGVLTGLGGGVLIVPILSFFQIDIRYAMGISLLSVIVLSLTTATTKTSELLTNVRIGIFLETAAVIGAICGAMLLPLMPIRAITVMFALVLIFTASAKKRHANRNLDEEKHDLNKDLSFYPRLKLGKSWFAMLVSGGLSGILGIGSGALKVLAMDKILSLPYKVSAATSNFMVGMTAAASIGIYLANDYIRYELTFPVLLGIYLGSFIGAKIMVIAKVHILRWMFTLVIYGLAMQMLYKGLIA